MRPTPASLALAMIIALFGPSALLGQDTQVVPDKPELSVRIVPPEPYLQEQIIQTVRVVAANIFEELVLDLPPVEGADVITLQQPKTRRFSTYGGEGYIYETRRAIFPKASGELRLAPVRVSGSIAISRDEREEFALRSDPVILDVKPPPADFKAPAWLVARRVEIDERWSQPIDQLRVGDHVTRTVEATVTGVTGGHLPELEHGRSSGLTILPGQTERSTEITSDEVIGKIRRSFELRIDTEQPINISPVRVVWWNTDTEIEWRSAAQSVRIEPLPRNVDVLVQNLMAEAEETHRTGRYGVMAMIALGGLGAILLLAWFLSARRRQAPEDAILLKAVRANPEPAKMVAALLAWGGTSFPMEKPVSLERLRQRLGEPAGDQLTALQRAAFGPGAEAVDSIETAKKIIAAARRQRGRSLADISIDLLRYLIGPKRHLPTISGGA